METRLPKEIRGIVPPVPKGWKLYDGPKDWKFVVGAKFWAPISQKWKHVRAFGTFAVPGSYYIVPESGLAFWFYRFMKFFL